MNINAASAILQSKLLIDPAYALSHLPQILQGIKDQISESAALYNVRMKQTPAMVQSLPQPRCISRSAFGLYTLTPYTSFDKLTEASIVIIDIIGPVLKYGSWYSWGTVELNDLIKRLSYSDKVKGILLNIDSGGGQAAGIADLTQTIQQVSQLKPVIAVVQDGVAASAAFWIASAAREIYVTQPTDQVGSIGAYTTFVDLTKYFENMGIVNRDIYAPQSVDKNQEYRNALKGDDTLIKDDLKFLVDYFIKNIKANRAGKINLRGDEPFTGKLYNAGIATGLGLIDGIKPVSFVVKRLEQLIALKA